MELTELNTTKVFSLTELLTFYKNIWQRNLIARLIDVETDIVEKSKNPDKLDIFELPYTRQLIEIPIKERLERRKIAVQDAVDLLAGIETLLKLSPEELTKKYSVEALAVAPDMIPKAEEKPAPAEAEKPAEQASVAKI